MAFWLTSVTLMPVTIESVRQLLTSGLPNSVFGGVGGIEMQRVLVHGQQREPDVVRFA